MVDNIFAYHRPFFRYFYVDLDGPCPFWHNEDGVCMMEGCSVCTCDEKEVPQLQLPPTYYEEVKDKVDDSYGWVSSTNSSYGFSGLGHDESLGRVTKSTEPPADSESSENHGEVVFNPYSLEGEKGHTDNTGKMIFPDIENDCDNPGMHTQPSPILFVSS